MLNLYLHSQSPTPTGELTHTHTEAIFFQIFRYALIVFFVFTSVSGMPVMWLATVEGVGS